MNEEPAPADPEASPVARLELIRLRERRLEYAQRLFVLVLGLGLGKAHYLWKAVLAKGCVRAKDCSRTDLKLCSLYFCDPSRGGASACI